MVSEAERKNIEAIRLAIREYTIRVTATRETAMRALIDEGFYTEDGRLTPQYGGDE